MEWTTDANKKVPVHFFARGYSWRVLGLFETDRHLLGRPIPTSASSARLRSARPGQWSRIMHGTQTSMTVGLVSVALSSSWASCWAASAGYVGGKTDQVIQRLIDFAVPCRPSRSGWRSRRRWPRDWTPIQVFFAIT